MYKTWMCWNSVCLIPSNDVDTAVVDNAIIMVDQLNVFAVSACDTINSTEVKSVSEITTPSTLLLSLLHL